MPVVTLRIVKPVGFQRAIVEKVGLNVFEAGLFETVEGGLNQRPGSGVSRIQGHAAGDVLFPAVRVEANIFILGRACREPDRRLSRPTR